MSITKKMTIAEVLRNHPETVPAFQQFGMHCLGCPSATGESLEQAAAVHGFDPDELIAALNKAIETK
jgi:hybrid cluster-associated redox disulfide protein